MPTMSLLGYSQNVCDITDFCNSMTHLKVRHDSFIHVTHSNVRHVSFKNVSHVWRSRVLPINVSHIHTKVVYVCVHARVCVRVCE